MGTAPGKLDAGAAPLLDSITPRQLIEPRPGHAASAMQRQRIRRRMT